jgi:hypothetical protein
LCRVRQPLAQKSLARLGAEGPRKFCEKIRGMALLPSAIFFNVVHGHFNFDLTDGLLECEMFAVGVLSL